MPQDKRPRERLVQPGEERALQGPNSSFPLPKGRLSRRLTQALHSMGEMGDHSDGRMRDNPYNLKQERVGLSIMRNVSP